MSVERPGSSNLKPWRPGQTGNPSGSSQRARARAAARKVGGLRSALRSLLDQSCPTELLATLTEEQRAAIDGDPTLGRFLAARLLTVAATARSIDDFLAALSLVASVDVRAEVPEPVTELDVLLRTFPRYLRVPLEAAVEAHRSGEDPVWAFETRLHRDLDEATRRRLLDAAFDGIELRELPPEELARRFERIDPADVETFSRVVTELRATPISEQLERFMTGGEPEWGR